ncbi:hypothetical protein AB4Z32_10400 [Massilia sp. 2TAF26]|uniref:hypothetical protein n=1 Tax=Massilia sp. 2TAF26 TaxID=3233012 RepID=UPI003F9BA997
MDVSTSSVAIFHRGGHVVGVYWKDRGLAEERRPANFNEFRISGLNACALQGTLDQMDALQQLQKAEKLPGELALGDSVYQLSQGSTSDRCVERIRILLKSCPYALSNNAKGKLLALRGN